MGLDRVIAVRNNKTIYRDGQKCIKVFSTDYTKAQIAFEAMNNAAVEETSLKVPKLLDVSFSADKYSIVSEYIRGETLAYKIENNPDKIDEYIELFSNEQLKIYDNTNLHLENQIVKFSRKIEKSNLDLKVKYDLLSRLGTMSKGNTLCHGDFNPTNIIITDFDIPYIIDWSDATVGDYVADVARTYLWFYYRYDVNLANKYLGVISDKGNISKLQIIKWLPIVAAVLFTDSSEDEGKFLLSWITNNNN